MAARKRSSRSPKRVSKRKSRSGLGASMLALGALLGLGGFSLWATSQHKNPSDALTSLFQRPTSDSKPSRSAPPIRAETNPIEKFSNAQKSPPKPSEKDFARAIGPVPRPIASVAPDSRPQPQQKKLSTVPSKQVSAPVGANTPAHSPSVVYAKTRLTIRKTAWDKSSPIGIVEKGREMRSYEKTGRWHRIAVPKTNLIGWVHEDQLIGGNKKPDSATIITGSIKKKSQPVETKPAQAVQKSRPQPPLAIGNRQ